MTTIREPPLLTTDYHKGTTTTYNHLNLPEKISTATGDEIRYTYDAAGTKLMQEVVQDGITQRTVYQNGVEYRSLNYTPGSKTVLAHIMTPEGRVLPLVEIDNTPECEPVYFPDPQNWTYHYDIKDHLGNVRVTLSDRRITDTYLATMESERADSEEALFGNINEDIREQDVLYNTTGECDAIELPDEMAHLNAVVGKITGPTKSLMVQNGDVVRLEVQAQYRDNTESNKTAMGSVLPSLLSALGIPTGGDGAAQVAYQAFDALFGAKVLLAKDNTDPVPYAYLYYQLFDINFRPVPTVAGMIGVSEAAATGPELLESNDINISERGFLYVWLSNESQWDVDVFFDDFRVAHEHSEIIQAQDYYPFGGPIQRFAGYQSKYLYQGKEWKNELNLALYDFHARQYDPWLGRFNGIDPLASSWAGVSPYAGMLNDPISYIDPDGRNPFLFIGAATVIGAGTGGAIAANQGYGMRDPEFWQAVGTGAVVGAATGAALWYFAPQASGLWGGHGGSFSSLDAGIAQAEGLTASLGGDMLGMQQATNWQPLNKSILQNYVQNNYCQRCSSGQLQQMTGVRFEDAWHRFARQNFPTSDQYTRYEGQPFPSGSGRNVVPDGMARGFTQTRAGRRGYPNSAWFEVKAKNSTIYNSTSSGQIRGHIDALARSQPIAARAGGASLNMVTTSGTNVSLSVYERAWRSNIQLYHWEASYRMTAIGQMQVRFGVRHIFSGFFGPAFNPAFSPVTF